MSEAAESMLDTSNLEEDLLCDNQEYIENIEFGKHVASIIDKGVVREESLTQARKEA